MAEGDAEWIGVDFEFGQPDKPSPTTPRPRPHYTPRPRPHYPPTTTPRPFSEAPHDAPDVAEPRPSTQNTNNVGVVGGAVGGVLGVVLLSLLVYMLVLRRRLTKARAAGEADKYQLRVSDVAHLSNLDHTQNTYVNTTDLQRFIASVKAKGKPPVIPPIPSRSSLNAGFRADSEVTVLCPPMAQPHSASAPKQSQHAPPVPIRDMPHPPSIESELVYSNHLESQPPALPPPLPSAPPLTSRAQPPRLPPPPSPVRRQSTSGPTSPSVVARPAPPPPKVAPISAVTTSPTKDLSPQQVTKPTPPPVALKPSKPQQLNGAAPAPPKPSAKPTPPTLPKPGMGKKGKALPPLKMVLSRGRDSCPTPDTALTNLTPDTASSASSVTAKVAFLEGKVGLMPLPGQPTSTT